VPYDAGFLLVRDGERHRDAFAAPVAYLRRETRGLAAGSIWPSMPTTPAPFASMKSRASPSSATTSIRSRALRSAR